MESWIVKKEAKPEFKTVDGIKLERSVYENLGAVTRMTGLTVPGYASVLLTRAVEKAVAEVKDSPDFKRQKMDGGKRGKKKAAVVAAA